MTWPTKKLGELCERIEIEKAPVRSAPYIEIGDINIETKQINFKEKGAVRGSIFAPAKCVIVSRVRPTRGAVALLDKKIAISSAFTILKPKSILDLKFLFYYLAYNHNFFEYLGRYQKGSNYPSCREKDILNFEIQLPPLQIQKRIVARIGELFEKIDKAKELRQKAQEETSQILFLALEQIFGRADKKWKLKKLGDITEIINGLVIKQSSENKSGYPISRIETPQNFEVDPRRVRYVEVSKELFHKYKYKTGDILFSHINSFELVGKVAIYRGFPKDLIHGMNLLRIRVKNKDICNPSFIFFYFVTKEFRSKIEPYIRRAVNQASLNQTNLKSIEIPLPPLSEQKKIVAELDTLREKVEKLKKYQEEQLKNLEELKKSILEKFLKGELVK